MPFVTAESDKHPPKILHTLILSISNLVGSFGHALTTASDINFVNWSSRPGCFDPHGDINIFDTNETFL